MLNLDFFADLHHGLVKLHGMPPRESIDLLYALNTIYLDSKRANGDRFVPHSPKEHFRRYLLRPPTRPPHVLMTLFDALESLEARIDMTALTRANPIRLDRLREQVDAMCSLVDTIDNVRVQFARLYGFEIEAVREAYDTIGMYELAMEYNPLPSLV